MGRPLRDFVAHGIYFVTARCFQRRLLLRPSKETEEVLGGVLARAARLYGVELFAFNFASNHMHLVVRAPRGNLPRFMQYLMTNISKKIGALVGWRGAFWERRYSAAPILDDAALLERVGYVLAHGVKEGLVRHCCDWPGLSSLEMMLDGQPRTFQWFNWTRRSSGNRHGETRAQLDPRWAEPEELRLATLPSPALQTPESLRRFFHRAVEAIEEEGSRQHKKVLGVEGVLRQWPQRRPPPPKQRKPRPPCHATVAALREGYLQRYRDFAVVFHEASRRWRSGDPAASFPDTAIKPFVWPLSEPPRLAA